MDGFMLKLLKLQHSGANQKWKASPTNNKIKRRLAVNTKSTKEEKTQRKKF